MGKRGPKVPDPYAVSDAQEKTNIRTAQEQARLGMTGQTTPYGEVQYVADPSSPSGYRAITSLSPEQQRLLTQSQGLQGQYGDVASAQLGRVSQTMATPFDMNAARGREISDIQRTFMDPQWETSAKSLESDLLNRGIRPGSEMYATMMRQFGQQRSDAYNKMYLDAYNTANAAALTERQIPMSELQGLGSMASPQGVQGVQPINTPQPGVAATNVSENVWNAYNAKAQAQQQKMGGAYGLGQAAMSMIPMLMMMSDIKVKRDIKKLWDHPDGWGVYEFKYITDETPRVGYLAQEVALHRPDAVHNIDGVLHVNYGAL